MSREAFESFMRREYENMPLDRIGTGEYREWFVWRTWQAWQACRAAALEEAASAAFNHFVDVCRERKVDQDFVRVWCSSDAIRALKEK